VTEPNSDVVYAQVVADPQSAARGVKDHEEVTAPTLRKENSAIIYSDLENIGTGTQNEAPSDELYANVI